MRKQYGVMRFTGNKALHSDAVTEQLDSMMQLFDSIHKHTVMQAVLGGIDCKHCLQLSQLEQRGGGL